MYILPIAPVRRSSQMEDAAYQSVVEAKVNSLTAQAGFRDGYFIDQYFIRPIKYCALSGRAFGWSKMPASQLKTITR